MGSLGDPLETVHTMDNYYDGPREGIADVGGKPHRYVSTWTDIDTDKDDVFKLYAVDEETLRLALESWAIWLRSEEAFQAGEASLDTHPALPADRERHEAIEARLAPRFADPYTQVPDAQAHAEFRVAEDRPPRERGWQPLQVRWRLLPSDLFGGRG